MKNSRQPLEGALINVKMNPGHSIFILYVVDFRDHARFDGHLWAKGPHARSVEIHMNRTFTLEP